MQGMHDYNRGFTLIELVTVIAVIGILAVLIVPKFFNLSINAQKAATKTIAGALSTANAANYGSRKINATLGTSISNCTHVATAMQGGLPTGYTITAAAVAIDTNVTCTLKGPGSTIATFTATGIT